MKVLDHKHYDPHDRSERTPLIDSKADGCIFHNITHNDCAGGSLNLT